MDQEAEHQRQHRELARLRAEFLSSEGDETAWLAALVEHLGQMHGIASSDDPSFLHRHLHPLT